LLLQVAEELLAFFQQRSFSVTVQRERTFQKSF
jgi:hypothetical protein